jgi:hypothetical protein
MEDLGLGELTVDINDVTGTALIQNYERLSKERQKYSGIITDALARYRQKQGKFLEYFQGE